MSEETTAGEGVPGGEEGNPTPTLAQDTHDEELDAPSVETTAPPVLPGEDEEEDEEDGDDEDEEDGGRRRRRKRAAEDDPPREDADDEATPTTANDTATGGTQTDSVDPSLPWSVRKKMMVMKKKRVGDQRYVPRGFSSGMNPFTEEERQKAEARLRRFEMKDKLEALEAQREESELKAKRAEKFGVPLGFSAMRNVESLGLNLEQAFANAQGARVDPGPEVEFDNSKLHVFCLDVDRQPFKSIRSPDLMAHFRAYGPTYIEWLGDRSCNVHFEDSVATQQALRDMFKELPPPTGVEEEKPEGSPTEETGEEGAEETGSTKAADDSDPNPESAEGTAEATEPKAPALPHLASMGWRICANPIKKRHIVVRYLGRFAIDDDVLMDRPERKGKKATLDSSLPSGRDRLPKGAGSMRGAGYRGMTTTYQVTIQNELYDPVMDPKAPHPWDPDPTPVPAPARQPAPSALNLDLPLSTPRTEPPRVPADAERDAASGGKKKRSRDERREGEDGDLAPRSEPESSNEAPRAKRFAAIGSTVLKRALATTYKDAANQLERNGGLSSGVRSQQMVQQARERIESMNKRSEQQSTANGQQGESAAEDAAATTTTATAGAEE